MHDLVWFAYFLKAFSPAHPLRMSTPTDSSLDAPARVAVRLLEADRISLGRAAELAGTDVRGMLDTLGYDLVPVVIDTETEASPA